MRRVSSVIIGLLLGGAFSLLLNASSLRLAFSGTLTVADLGASQHSADEAYYFAQIRDVRDGHVAMGNTSFRDLADAPAVAGYALLPQGLLVRAGFPVEDAVLLGDLLFPVLIACLLFLLGTSVGMTKRTSALFTASFLLWHGIGFLRTMNPQVTLTVFLVTLLLFFRDPGCKHPWAHGAMLGLLVLVQPLYALFIAVLHTLSALLRPPSSFRRVLRERYPVALLPAAAALFTTILLKQGDPAVLTETLFRRGLIESRLPAAPAMQILLTSAIGVFLWKLPRELRKTSEFLTMLLMLIAALLCLNLSVFTGVDAVFGLYFRPACVFALLLFAFRISEVVISSRIAVSGTAIFMLLLIPSFVRGLSALPSGDGTELRDSGLIEALETVDRLDGTRVVLAPLDVSNLVPVLTRHTALFTQYAHFEYASDKELAERYLTQGAFFPYLPEHLVEGHPLVFGIGAGNLYGRTKTLCTLTHPFHRETCDARSLSDFILRQDVRVLVDRGTVDRMKSAARFGVDTVVTQDPLPSSLQQQCTRVQTVRTYTVYDCDLAS